MIRWPSLCSVPSRLGEPHAEAGGLGGHCLSIQKENSSKDKGRRLRSDAVSVRRQAGLARRIRRGHVTPLRLWEARKRGTRRRRSESTRGGSSGVAGITSQDVS